MGAKSAIFVLFYYSVIFCLILSSSVFSKAINCGLVSQNLKSVLSIGKERDPILVESSIPFYDPQMRICYHGLRSAMLRSCCTNQMENEYMRFGQKRMKKMMSFQTLKKKLKAKRNAFIREETNFRDGVTSYLSDLISYRLRLHKPLLRPPIRSFLGQLLSNHTRPPEVTILDNFIVAMSPLIYYQTIKNGDMAAFVRQKQDCLASSYRKRRGAVVLQPKESLIGSLQRAKRANQRLQNSVVLMLRVLRQLEALKYPKECLEAVTRTQLCPICFGGARRGSVCGKACQNIFNGCHMHWADLEPSWDRFVSSAKELSDRIVARLDLASALRTIVDSVVQNLFQNVLPKLRELDEQLRSDCFVNGHEILPVGHRRIYDGKLSSPFPSYVTDHLRSFSVFLGQQINFFTNLLQRTCAHLPETECWNGTFFSSRGYTKPVPDFYLANQKNNPEVSRRNSKQKEVVGQLIRDLDNNYSDFDAHDVVQSTRYLGPPMHQPLGSRGSRRYEGSGGGGVGGAGIDTEPDGSGDPKHQDDEDMESSGNGRLPVPKSMTAEPTISLVTSPRRLHEPRPRMPPPRPTATPQVTVRKQPPSYTVRIVSPTPNRSKNAASFLNPSFTLYFFALLLTKCLLVLL